MTYNYQTQPIFSATEMGLKRVFASIVQTPEAGMTLSTLSSQTNIASTDLPFLQILQESFQTSDENHDGVISQEELTKMISKINQQGLTQEQIASLASQNAFSSDSQKELIENILSDFKKIDANGDGRVTKAEVDKYLINKEIEDKKEEFEKSKLAGMTVFYASDTSTSDSSSS